VRSLFKENAAEALIGLLVVLIALWFGWTTWQRTGGGRVRNAIEVKALFPSATGVNVGTDVRVAGIKVGQVANVSLDPKTFQAEVTLALDPNVKIPDDSSAVVASEGILGGTYMGLMPGGSPTPLKNGDMILDTQGSTDLMSLVGQFINKSGGSAPAGGAGGSADQTGGNAAAPASANP
jgi:phospholipid/cholesterol/gamma-HCH transport system substrate-binding protein